MKRKIFSKALALFICMATVISLLAGAVSAYAVGDIINSRATVSTRFKSSPYTSASGEGANGINGDIGMRLNIATEFTGVQFKLATYLQNDITADISVYKWIGSYISSISSSPVYTEQITLKDNAMQGVTFDRELEAGDYLFRLHNQTKAIAIYAYSSVEGFSGYVYRDGYPSTSNVIYPSMQILFPKKSDSYFLACSKPDDIVDGNHTSPSGGS